MTARSREGSKHGAAPPPQARRRSRARATLPPAAAGDLPRDLLDRPALEGARWLTLLRLEELRAAHRRLQGDDAEDGLHRFRVALRRLRGTIRELRDLLDDSISRKTRRQLAALAAAAGARRDLDVHLAWLADELAALDETERADAELLERALRREWRAADAALRREIDRGYDRVVRRLGRRLRRYRVTMELGTDRPLEPTRAALGAALDRLANNLEGELSRMRAIDADRAIHKTRIAAKRLRYVLEPLAARAWRPVSMVRAAGDAVAELKVLQDDLGLLHDSHLLAGWLADRAAEAAARAARHAVAPDAGPDLPDAVMVDADVAPAVVRTLQRRLRERAAATWADLETDARRAARARTIAAARRVAERLAAV